MRESRHACQLACLALHKHTALGINSSLRLAVSPCWLFGPRGRTWVYVLGGGGGGTFCVETQFD